MDKVIIPQSIDQPPQILFWKATELAPVMIGLVCGIVTGHAAILSALGFALVHVYRRAAESRPDGAFIHTAYWWGLAPLKGSTIPNPFMREFLP